MRQTGKVLFGLVGIILLVPPATGWAEPVTADVLITELQVRSGAATNAANEEFVELYNVTDQPIDVSAWSLEYKSATGTSWTHKVTLHGMLAARSRYLLVSDKYTSLLAGLSDQSTLGLDIFSAGLADSAGHVRIVSQNMDIPALPLVHDTLGWGGTADSAEGDAPATAPAGGKSLKRQLDNDGKFIDTDNNASDFTLDDTPLPEADPLYVAPPDETPPDPEPVPDDPEPEPAVTPENNDQTAPPAEEPADTLGESIAVPAPLPPHITELLPNPAAPASDSTDEFIELYNPNDQPLDLSGYKLQSGNTFSYSYTFAGTSLNAHEYRAFLVTETGDILSNTGGQARLLDPAGAVVAQTNAYDAADDGDAWALINGAWQWTTTATPNAPNVLTLPVLKLASTKTTAKKAAAKPTAKKAATAKVASAKTAKTTKPKAAAAERQVYEDPAEAPSSIHPGILAGVGVITLVYAGYEYRYDVINRLRQLQRYRDIRRAARAASKG